MLKLIQNNPYRVLGVYANSPRRDIVANKGRATAFLRVHQAVEYPLDLKGILPSIERTLEDMNEAEAHLAIAKEQIKYAQLWFLQKMSPLDDIAFNRLLAGNLSEAIEIWLKQDTLSSLQNRLICYLINGDYDIAVQTAEKLYEKYGNDYISKVDANCPLQMTATDLLHQFLDSLGEEIGMQNFLGSELGEGTLDYIRRQAIEPLINKISSEVERVKKVDHKDSDARMQAARQLVTNTKEEFNQIKRLLPQTDAQYVMVADKLGLEILQCGIDYYNNSEDEDAPYKAIKVQKYAQTIVAGTMAKNRCDENVKILEKIIAELPPKEVRAEDKAIKAELARFVKLPDKISYAFTLLNNTKPHFQSIKLKLGGTNDYYLKKSTLIVKNALHNVVEEVNAVQNDPIIKVSLQYGLSLDSNSLSKIKSVVREAWRATIMMDGFDLEADFKSHYTNNRNTLKTMCDNLGIPTGSLPIRTPIPTVHVAPRMPISSHPSSNSSSADTNTSPSEDKNWGCIMGLACTIIGLIVGAINGNFMAGLFIGGVIGSILNGILSND